mmetsp:Transcript_20885/g.54434  ORF Transcript_20885/g.54434 Transcript_20885/m.54434 type:complete len:150 (+) Transcript_20885:513-962(+)
MEQMCFGHTLSPLMADRTLEPPLNGPLLMEQADAAYKILGEAQLAGRQTAGFWASLTCNVDLREQLSVWLALASIASVQVSGSLEEERLFSKLASRLHQGRAAQPPRSRAFECVLSPGNPAHLHLRSVSLHLSHAEMVCSQSAPPCSSA